ncbi:MAG: PstS family phosphate ABC transporter substrate-binding protein [Phormidesmis sp.]
MSKSNNETSALIVTLAITAAIIGGAAWWLKDSGLLQLGEGSPTLETTQNNSDGGSAGGGSAGAGFSDVTNVPSGRFTYGGSTTWAPLRGVADPVIGGALPNFKLEYRDASGSSDGIAKLIAGELDFAQSSRPLEEAEKQQAQAAGFALEEIPVAMEGVAIATNPNLSIPGLTLNQIKGIYTGQITNWSQVGGPNLAIVPASRSNDGGTVQFFQETVLAGQPFTPNTQRLSTTTAALRFVSDNPGAIYFASAPEVVGQCTVAPLPIGAEGGQLVPPYQQPYVAPANCPSQRNQLNLSAFQSQAYPLTRPLYVIIRKDGQPAEQAGTAYAQLLKTQEGARLLQQAGFVPLP